MRTVNITNLGFGKLLSLAIGLSSLTFSSTSIARDVQIEISGTVGTVCSVPSDFADTSAPLGDLVDPGGFLGESEVLIEFGVVTCNSATNISVKSTNGGLILAGDTPAPEGFVKKVKYKVNVDWSEATLISLDSEDIKTTPASAPTTKAQSEPVSIKIYTTSDGTIFPVPGTYNDTLTLRVGGIL